MAKKKFDFAAELRTMLVRIGAQPSPEHYELMLETRAGVLYLAPYDNWLAARFDDPERAKSVALNGSLNRFSGKWNWHCMNPTMEDVSRLEAQIRYVL